MPSSYNDTSVKKDLKKDIACGFHLFEKIFYNIFIAARKDATAKLATLFIQNFWWILNFGLFEYYTQENERWCLINEITVIVSVSYYYHYFMLSLFLVAYKNVVKKNIKQNEN